MTEREEMFRLLDTMYRIMNSATPVIDELKDIMARNQNEGCGGDRTMSSTEWLATRNLIWEVQTSIVEVQTILPSTEIALRPIEVFMGTYRFLSNFWYAEVYHDGLKYKTVEHAFQASKSLDPNVRRRIQSLDTPALAKSTGRQIDLRSDWESVKVPLMFELVLQKFTQHKDLRNKLIQTGNVELIEGNTWGDNYWGMVEQADGTYKGQNMLGKILMKVREKVR